MWATTSCSLSLSSASAGCSHQLYWASVSPWEMQGMASTIDIWLLQVASAPAFLFAHYFRFAHSSWWTFSTLTCCKEYENEAAANSVQVWPVYINCETFFGSTAATKGPWRVRTERITSSETRGWWFAGTFLQIGPGLKTAQFRGLKAKMPRNASDFVRTYSNL